MSDECILKSKLALLRFSLDNINTTFATANVANFNYLKGCITHLETLQCQFQEWQNDVIIYNASLDPSLKKVSVQKETKEFLDLCSTIRGKFFSLEANFLAQSGSPASPVAQSTSSAHSNSANHTPSQVELNMIPVFTGNIKDYKSFIDIYNEVVHKTNIGKIHKLLILRSKLKGDPLSIIQNYDISEVSYDLSYKKVTERYTSVRVVASHHVNSLLNCSLKNTTLQEFIRIHESVNSNLKNLLNANLGDFVLFHLGYLNLDQESRKGFDNFCTKDIPTIEDLSTFLASRCKTEQINAAAQSHQSLHQEHKKQSRSLVQRENSKSVLCPCCFKQEHQLWYCPSFLQLSPKERFNLLKRKQLCIKCLKAHPQPCPNAGKCKHCSRTTHNSLLCFNQDSSEKQSNKSKENPKMINQNDNQPKNITNEDIVCTARDQSEVLLSTLQAHTLDSFNTTHIITGLVDNCSQISLITKQCADLLGLNIEPISGSIQGISGAGPKKIGSTQFTIYNKNPHSQDAEWLTIDATVIDKITGNFPSHNLHKKLFHQVSKYHLADPQFCHSKQISFLLGSLDYCKLISGLDNSRPVFIEGTPCLQLTRFGYLALGPTSHTNSINNSKTFFTLDHTSPFTVNDMHQFWDTEDPEGDVEDSYADLFFDNHLTRLDNGSYQGKYPEKLGAPQLGVNDKVVLQQYLHQEAKLKKRPDIKAEYDKFLKEYLQLGHMSHDLKFSGYFLLHHAVFKDGDDTKIRVVFNGNTKDNRGNSVNSILEVGPPLQKDITVIMTQFRLHPVGFVCDVEKMYRGFLIHPDQHHLQRIIWRPDSMSDPQAYVLNTITYGLNSSPFAAIKCLQRLAEDEKKNYPVAAKVIQNSFYVDDCVCSVDSVVEGLELKRQLVGIFKSANLTLKKWCSSHPEIISDIPLENREKSIELGGSSAIKVLGLKWATETDQFLYSVIQFKGLMTKREIMSFTAKLWDPMNFLLPLLTTAKLLIQVLWLKKLEWDEIIPLELQKEWNLFLHHLPQLENMRIPRFIPILNNSYRLVIFCDSSMVAYAAVAYIQIEGSTNSFLLQAKGRVAPARKKQTIPRLELNSAVLAAKLYNHIVTNLKELQFSEILLCSDSQVVLSWIKSTSVKLPTYVNNRVNSIKQLSQVCQWYYIQSKNNISDLATRGCQADHLLRSGSWWHGPPFLEQPRSIWPLTSIYDINIQGCVNTQQAPDDTAIDVVLITTEENNLVYEHYKRFSSYYRVVLVHAFVLRFINQCRIKRAQKIKTINPSSFIRKHPVTVMELRNSEIDLIRLSQLANLKNLHFSLISQGKKGSLKGFQELNPFIDNSVIRVGGRLQNSSLPFAKKHPLIVSKDCFLPPLIVRHYHRLLAHAGPTLVAAALREKFWLTSARVVIRRELKKCIVCLKNTKKGHQPMMANLPSSRVQPTRCFSYTGMDFAGHFLVKSSLLKKAPVTKGYFVVFICLTYRAIHIEFCSDLSTDCFLAALHRFVSRRGKPIELFSDCGSNFKGADNEFKKIAQLIRDNKEIIVQDMAKCDIKWSFNPPISPNFGGSWEIHVKIIKQHLYKLIGDRIHTYEEYSTLFTRIEGIVNSRPLCTLSTTTDNLDFLTPAHFLVGSSLLTVPEVEVDLKATMKNRYSMIQHYTQQLWKRWSREYLQGIVKRSKWTKSIPNPQVGQVVYLMELNSSPMHWPLGIILKTHPSRDGVVRVVTVRCLGKEYVRPCNKLILFPLSLNDQKC